MNAADYRRAQDRAIRALLQQVRRLFLTQGVPVTEEQVNEMAALLLRSMRGARERVHAAAEAYILSEYAIAEIPDLAAYPLDALSKALSIALDGVTVNGAPVTAANRKDGLVTVQVGKLAQRVASRHAQQPAREAVKTVADNHPEIGWARLLMGPTSCAFCAMLASRGPVYKSDKSALYRGGSPVDAFHNGCDCVAVLVTNPNVWEGRAAHDNLERLWVRASHRKGDTRKAFRREWDSLVRAGGTRDYLAESVK